MTAETINEEKGRKLIGPIIENYLKRRGFGSETADIITTALTEAEQRGYVKAMRHAREAIQMHTEADGCRRCLDRLIEYAEAELARIEKGGD